LTTGIIIGIIVLIGFLIALFLGTPVCVSMILSGVIGSMLLLREPFAAFTFLTSEFLSTFTSYSLCVAPMFILMGEIASESKIGTNLFSSLQIIVGRVRGGLANATQIGCAVFGALCGSGGATAALMCRVAYPEMKKYNYSDLLSTGCIASSASLATLIPPSVFLITYGIAAEESIGKLFAGGIFCGIVLTILLIITSQIWGLINPSIAPAGVKTTMKEKLKAIRDGHFIEIFLVFALSMGGMFAGWFTPTEGGAVGVACMVLLSIYLKRFNLKVLLKAAENTLVMCGMMYALLASAMVFSKFFTLTHIPTALGNFVTSFNIPVLAVILVITLTYAVLGCFIDSLPLMLLTTPIFLPVVKAIGYDPVWFGCYIVMIMGLAAITPPVGISCYIVSGMCEDVPITRVFKGSMPFFVTFIIMAFLMGFFPEIATWLPSKM